MYLAPDVVAIELLGPSPDSYTLHEVGWQVSAARRRSDAHGAFSRLQHACAVRHAGMPAASLPYYGVPFQFLTLLNISSIPLM